MEKYVHVVPLGWERERAVGPIIDAKAHRVYILRRTDHQRTAKYAAMVRQDLKPHVSGAEIHEVDLDEPVFDSVLLHVARLILSETAAGNRVYLNMSAAWKVDAAAATMAGMYHSDKLGGIYYARTTKYAIDELNPKQAFEENGLSLGYAGTTDLPKFRIQHPRDAAVRALAVLYEDGASSLVHLVVRLRDDSVEGFVGAEVWEAPDGDGKLEKLRKTNVWAQRFRRTVLDELRRQGLVRQLPRGTKGQVKLELTKDGEYHALISGHVSNLRTPTEKGPAATAGSGGAAGEPSRKRSPSGGKAPRRRPSRGR